MEGDLPLPWDYDVDRGKVWDDDADRGSPDEELMLEDILDLTEDHESNPMFKFDVFVENGVECHSVTVNPKLEDPDLKMFRFCRDNSKRSKVFLMLKDDAFDSLPPRMIGGDLSSYFLDAHLSDDFTLSFDEGFTSFGVHVRCVQCSLGVFTISGVCVCEAFHVDGSLVLVMEGILPVMGYSSEPIRKHQVKERKLRPGDVQMFIFGVEEKHYKVFLEVSEPVNDITFTNSVEPSVLDIYSTGRNLSHCPFSKVSIRHSPTHSGYRHITHFNICIRDKNNTIELLRIVEEFHMHNSGHTLPKEERKWRNQTDGRNASSISSQPVESTTKSVQTDCSIPVPPLFSDFVRKKRFRFFVSSKDASDDVDSLLPSPPSLEVTQAPSVNNYRPISPIATGRDSHSPLSPLDLHMLEKRLIIERRCFLCRKEVNEDEEFDCCCDRCGVKFHFECLLKSEGFDELDDQQEFFCERCKA
jgi:hypothetical protein